MESMKDSVMAMINDLAAQVKQNGKAAPEPVKPAKDGIACQRCGNTGWVAITRDDGTVAMAHCPECFERRQVAHRLRTSGILRRIMNGIRWSALMKVGVKRPRK